MFLVEFILSILKICGCVGFIIFGTIVACGGVGDQGYLGAKYWHNPGAFANGFKGFCSVFVVAAFAFGGYVSFPVFGVYNSREIEPSSSVLQRQRQPTR